MNDMPGRFRGLLRREELLMLPGAYDAMTAKLIQLAGFPALFVTGAGVSLSLLAQPDLETVSYLELRNKAEEILSATGLPALVDVDTGGNPLNLIRLVRDFERIGVAAIQLEDQATPKRCGHEQGRRVVSPEEMCLRIRAVLDARSGPEGLVLVARTDARTSLGLDEAIRRANLYLEAGADLIFVESPESEDEVIRICREVQGPILYNNVEGGRSPFLSREQLQADGVRAVIYPNTLTRIMVPAARRLLAVLQESGTTESLWPEMITHRDLWPLFGSEEWLALERRYRV
ncbi:MAG: isocitrate lyase/PEP mutase family protein [Firmicutes bacterium]|nr:isocitrate lyase/PEP mutase family protein [Bacillota bacterium]